MIGDKPVLLVVQQPFFPDSLPQPTSSDGSRGCDPPPAVFGPAGIGYKCVHVYTSDLYSKLITNGLCVSLYQKATS